MHGNSLLQLASESDSAPSVPNNYDILKSLKIRHPIPSFDRFRRSNTSIATKKHLKDIDYQRYIPQTFYKKHRYTLRKKIAKQLNSIASKENDSE